SGASSGLKAVIVIDSPTATKELFGIRCCEWNKHISTVTPTAAFFGFYFAVLDLVPLPWKPVQLTPFCSHCSVPETAIPSVVKCQVLRHVETSPLGKIMVKVSTWSVLPSNVTVPVHVVPSLLKPEMVWIFLIGSKKPISRNRDSTPLPFHVESHCKAKPSRIQWQRVCQFTLYSGPVGVSFAVPVVDQSPTQIFHFLSSGAGFGVEVWPAARGTNIKSIKLIAITVFFIRPFLLLLRSALGFGPLTLPGRGPRFAIDRHFGLCRRTHKIWCEYHGFLELILFSGKRQRSCPRNRVFTDGYRE